MIALVLAGALVLAPAEDGAPEEQNPAGDAPADQLPTAKADAKAGSIEDHYYRGAAHYSGSDYAKAIEHFTTAIELAARDNTDPNIRAALLYNLARAHVRSYDVDNDVVHLRQAVDIYRRFIEEVDMLGLDMADQVAAATEGTEELRAQIESHERSANVPAGGEPTDESEATSRRRRGIGLTIGGGLGLAAGVGVAVFGTTFKSDAEKAIENSGDPPEVTQLFLDDETAKGRTWIGTGIAVGAVSTALLVWGIVDLAASKSSGTDERRLGLGPWAGKGLTGASLSGRF